MKQDRLNIHYETLYKIIECRYKGLSPESIKKVLINSDIDFDIDTPKKDTTKTLNEKKLDYINSEVGRALKVLTKNAKSNNELEDYDDKFYFDDESDVDDKQREDYKYYPHSILIGEAKVLNNNKVSKRNGSYRLNKNIKFSITDSLELRISSKFLYMLFTTEKENDVNDEMVSYLTQRKEIESENQEFSTLIDTFIQLSMHEIYMPNKQYTLDILLILISLGATINMNIQNHKSTYTLNNIVIDELNFEQDKFDIVCDGIKFTISDLADIKLIESACSSSISDNIFKLQKILPNYSKEFQKSFIELIENFESVHQIFMQNY